MSECVPSVVQTNLICLSLSLLLFFLSGLPLLSVPHCCGTPCATNAAVVPIGKRASWAAAAAAEEVNWWQTAGKQRQQQQQQQQEHCFASTLLFWAQIFSHYFFPSPPPASANCIHQSTSLALSCLCAAAAVAVAGAQCPFPMIMCVDRQTNTHTGKHADNAPTETHFRQDCIASMVMMHINLATRRCTFADTV